MTTPINIKNLIKPLLTPPIPKDISSRFRYLDKKNLSIIEASLKAHFFIQQDAWYSDANYLSSAAGQEDLQDHLTGRLEHFRLSVIPWLNSVRPLAGSKILEIGCGTGVSTVALAEQGAKVTALDVVEESLIVAKKRCEVYGLDVAFLLANSTEVHKLLAGQDFDFIIFFACLEHMTHSERMLAMKSTWDMLATGSFWCLVDTPNRLWYYDQHTAHLPFYSWLPDDLAFAYSRFSPRKPFSSLYHEITDDSMLDFLRRGRGVSYHEFELTMKPAEQLEVISSLTNFLKSRNFLTKILWSLKDRNPFESLLIKLGPKIHQGFYQSSLDLIIRKN
ncbi:class I SAM-dependent methyltransferase [uncultured Thiothrix sp.]|mgnify:CR=1 FL=1|uniref:class I SAM-dependent methyltransferase n=1 Tax=uncultured Thiothrix sp. TaxID=223185 RepID=UPI00260E98ED|nr:class I SAM-dependent methyltransferase [uncultured Thiothrix sp.]